jgi:RNA polymerase sigma-70 factor (ECF subfamily)
MQVAIQLEFQQENLNPKSPGEEHKNLIRRIVASRDRLAFKQLFLHFGPRVKAMMMKSGADHAAADDLVQDVMMSVWRKCDLYKPDRGAVSTWIFTIARNARIDRLRRGSSQPYDDIDQLEVVSDEADAEQEIFEKQRASLVSKAILALPDDQQQVMKLAFISDLPQSEIARVLSLPLGTVKSRMRLAYGKLRSKLKDAQ